MILVILSIIGVLMGLFLIFKPDSAIEIQRRFYEKINWRIEPISMQKEIRNTKIMGIIFILAIVLSLVYKIIQIPR